MQRRGGKALMTVWALTDTGLVRRQNQDAYGVEHLPDGRGDVCVVCDGMGGPKGGGIASRIAVDAFLDTLRENLKPGMAPEQIREISSYATAVANEKIRQRAAEDPDACYGMGTTLVAAVSYAGGVVVSNVGDSRAYLINCREIRRISRDHSLVETLVERGDITEAEARRHPKRNYITRALGPEERTLCDGYIVPMEQGEFILLCTDGLVSTVSDQEMRAEILDGADLDHCLERLLEISKQNGAADNVTAVLMRKE